jgi:hypothetical protein
MWSKSIPLFKLFFIVVLIGIIGIVLSSSASQADAWSAAHLNIAPLTSPHTSPQPVPTLFAPVSLSPGTRVLESSPALADLNGDGRPDIIVGTSNGYVVVVNGATGALLWKRDVRNYGFISPSYPNCGTDLPIRSSPAVGHLRAPGSTTSVLGIVVGVGDILSTNGNGGVIAFDKNGNHLWTHLTRDGNPSGCTDGVVSSPTVVDLDHSGYDEVIFGAFDHRVYVLTDTGVDIPPWPFWTRDTQWSSPAVGDINGDGQMEIILASDVGRLDQHCPYPLEWSADYCGGSISARRLDATELPGFPYYTWQAIQSQPALADLNGDGKLDIIVGSGTYYNTSQLTPNDSFLLYAIDYAGRNVPGWPVNLQGVTDGEPAVADLDGDGDLEVVMGTGNAYCYQGNNYNPPHQALCPPNHLAGRVGWLYAIYHDGNIHRDPPITGDLTGPFMWSAQPLSTGGSGVPGPIRAPMIADYNNDGILDVIYSLQWEVQARNGLTGAPEIGGYNATSMMMTKYTLSGAPAIGDLNGDGKLDIVAASAAGVSDLTGQVYVWTPQSLIGGKPAQPWPMFRQSPDHLAHYAFPMMTGGLAPITLLRAPGRFTITTYTFSIGNTGDEPFRLTISDSDPHITVQPATPVTIDPDAAKTFTVTINLGSDYVTPGLYSLGTITISGVYGAGSGIHAINSPVSVPVQVRVVDHLYDVFAPLVQNNATP